MAADRQPLFDDRDGILYAALILALSCCESGQPAMDLEHPQLAKIYAGAPALIPEAVISIDHFRRQQERWASGRPVQPRRAEKVGRNAPCPSGSGRKYKVCCGPGAGWARSSGAAGKASWAGHGVTSPSRPRATAMRLHGDDDARSP